MIREHRAPRRLLAALALSILTLPGCQAPVGSPGGPVQPGKGFAATEALPPEIVDSAPAPSVTLALLGDVMLGRDVHPTPETFTYLKPFLASADLALANLESPLTNAPAQSDTPYLLCAPPENVRYLVGAGFDYLSLSNNHRLDCGTDGLLETQETLADAELGFIGPDPEPLYRSINEIQLALLAFDATTDFDLEAAVRAVRSARETDALVIVSMHWGAEYQAGASTSQTQIAGQLADAGAALIWGHHLHVLQPSAWIQQKTSMGDRQTLVFYSLGNALFDPYGLQSTRRSALALVTLTTRGVEGFKVVPFVIDNQAGQASRLLRAGQRDAEIIGGYFE